MTSTLKEKIAREIESRHRNHDMLYCHCLEAAKLVRTMSE
jgi:hypothetical protein